MSFCKMVIKYFFISICIFITPLVVYSSNVEKGRGMVLQELSQLQWKKRVVLLFLNDENKDVVQMLKHQEMELIDRHIAWFVIDGTQVHSNYDGDISQSFVSSLKEMRSKIDETKSQQVILIGKDGGIKDKNDTLDFQGLYALIDGMPMRRSEMNNK